MINTETFQSTEASIGLKELREVDDVFQFDFAFSQTGSFHINCLIDSITVIISVFCDC